VRLKALREAAIITVTRMRLKLPCTPAPPGLSPAAALDLPEAAERASGSFGGCAAGRFDGRRQKDRKIF